MKNRIRIVLSLSCAVCALLLVSCLGDSGNSILVSAQEGVVRLSPKKVIMVKGGFAISSEEFEKQEEDDGTCCLVDYTLDHGLPQNGDAAQANGFYTVTIQRFVKVPNWTSKSSLTDTTKLLPREQTIAGFNNRLSYVDGNLFLETKHTNYITTPKDVFDLSYNPDQETQTDKDGKRYYELYLRVSKEEALPDTIRGANVIMTNAFAVKDFVDKFTDKELLAGKDSLNFKLVYAQGFRSDSTRLSLASSDLFTIKLADKKE